MRQVDIVKIDLSTGKAERRLDFVAEEGPLHLFVNTTFWWITRMLFLVAKLNKPQLFDLPKARISSCNYPPLYGNAFDNLEVS